MGDSSLRPHDDAASPCCQVLHDLTMYNLLPACADEVGVEDVLVMDRGALPISYLLALPGTSRSRRRLACALLACTRRTG